MSSRRTGATHRQYVLLAVDKYLAGGLTGDALLAILGLLREAEEKRAKRIHYTVTPQGDQGRLDTDVAGRATLAGGES